MKEKAINIYEYRSPVGQLMFFATKLGPKLENATQALSGFMQNPGTTHWVAIGRVIGYIKIIKVKGILYVKPKSKKVIAFADTDFGDLLRPDEVLDVV